MIRFIGIILVFSMSSPLLAWADEVVIMYSYGRKGPMQYSISRDKAARLPRWESIRKEPPLEVKSAIQRAEAWFHNSYPDVKDWQPISVSLSSSNRQDKDYAWYYTIMLQPRNSAAYKTIDDTVMILMDGSVVEPKPKEK